MKNSKNPKLFGIEPKGGNPVLRGTLALTRGLVEHSLRLDGIEKIYRDSKALDDDAPFAEKILRAMNVRIEIPESDLERIPAEGPVVVVANHPFGGVEGIVLLALLERVRPDFKILANFMLGRIPELRERFIFVDPFGAANSARSNIRPLRQSFGWLKQGGVLGTFPAGEVSSVDLRTGKVRDPEWMPATGRLVRHSGAVVVPVFFSGHNGPLFQLAGLVHPRFRTLMLPRQVINKRNREIRLHIGRPIPPREIREFSDDRSLTNYLRLRTYVLAGREPPPGPRRRFLPRRKPLDGASALEPVADPVDPSALQSEVAGLEEECRLLSSAEYDVYAVEGRRIPKLLQEIGRLREITFRGVGEGAGRALDLDRFDLYYLHLFIWNRDKREIVGAYRLGRVDDIVQQYGTRGLYTSTLFRFNDKLVHCLHPAIELGRSFVRPEYQRAYTSLLLLWKGIGVYLARHPRYRTLFGPVSITNEYRVSSRNLLLRSLRLSNFAPEMARFVKPRKRPRPGSLRAEWNHPDFNPFFKDLDQVSAMIQDIENDHKGVPILVRQYLKLGGKILAFNLDPAFSSVVDALIAMDLTETDPKVLSRYMGRENAETFLQAHRLSATNPAKPPEPPAGAPQKRGRPRKPRA